MIGKRHTSRSPGDKNVLASEIEQLWSRDGRSRIHCVRSRAESRGERCQLTRERAGGFYGIRQKPVISPDRMCGPNQVKRAGHDGLRRAAMEQARRERGGRRSWERSEGREEEDGECEEISIWGRRFGPKGRRQYLVYTCSCMLGKGNTRQQQQKTH